MENRDWRIKSLFSIFSGTWRAKATFEFAQLKTTLHAISVILFLPSFDSFYWTLDWNSVKPYWVWIACFKLTFKNLRCWVVKHTKRNPPTIEHRTFFVENKKETFLLFFLTHFSLMYHFILESQKKFTLWNQNKKVSRWHFVEKAGLPFIFALFIHPRSRNSKWIKKTGKKTFFLCRSFVNTTGLYNK